MDTIDSGTVDSGASMHPTSTLEMPPLGFGTYQLSDQSASDMVALALELGVRHIDTAQMYRNEAAVGRAIRASGVARGDVFLTTKLDNDQHEPDRVVSSLEASLGRLDTDHVDLFLVHWPVDWSRMGATLSAMNRVQAEGLARHIGVSNFTTDQLEYAADFAPIEVLQAECHPFFQQNQLRQWCRDHHMAFTAYSPLAKGEVFDDEVLSAIAAEHESTPSQVALAYLLSFGGVSVIPRTSSPDHLRDNLGATSISLSEADRARLASIDSGRRLVSPQFALWSS